MTTYQIYSSAVDDVVASADVSSYADARAGSGVADAVGFLGDDVSVYAGQAGDTSFAGAWTIYQGCFAFDTSAVPAGSDSNASITFYIRDDLVPDVAKNFEIREHNWDAANAATSYVPGASLSGKTLFGSASVSSADALTTKTFTSALTSIPRSSAYEVILCAEDARTNTAPGSSAAHVISVEDGAVGANPPMLQFDVGAAAATSSVIRHAMRPYLHRLNR